MINCWCHKWRINLNLKNMKVLLFSGKHKRKFKEEPCLLSYKPLQSTPTSSLEAELNVQPINIRLEELVSMENLKIMRKTACPHKNSLINAYKNPRTFLSPLQNLLKQGKKTSILYIRSNKCERWSL